MHYINYIHTTRKAYNKTHKTIKLQTIVLGVVVEAAIGLVTYIYLVSQLVCWSVLLPWQQDCVSTMLSALDRHQLFVNKIPPAAKEKPNEKQERKIEKRNLIHDCFVLLCLFVEFIFCLQHSSCLNKEHCICNEHSWVNNMDTNISFISVFGG